MVAVTVVLLLHAIYTMDSSRFELPGRTPIPSHSAKCTFATLVLQTSCCTGFFT